MGATCQGQHIKPETLEIKSNQKQAAKPLRTLLVEHSRDDIDLILQELKQSGFAVDYEVAENRDEFVASITQNSFDAVLSHYRLPNWNGLDALSAMRGVGKDIPFILITGTLGEEAAVECIKQGVSDYVLKDNLARLPLVLGRALTEKSLREENARAQEALRISEARNRDLVENSAYGVLRVTADGTFLDVNPAALRILGCTKACELGSVNLASDVFRFPAHYSQLAAACGENGQVHGAEAEWRRRNGGLVTVRLHLRRISGRGEPDGFEIVAEDVTELRVMERQLRQAQKFEAVGQLAGGVAHDFNNVIGAILGWAELGLDQSRDNPAVAERFGRIRDQAARAAGLTRELLAFGRRQVLQPQPTDLNSVATSLVTFLDKVIGKDIESVVSQRYVNRISWLSETD